MRVQIGIAPPVPSAAAAPRRTAMSCLRRENRTPGADNGHLAHPSPG